MAYIGMTQENPYSGVRTVEYVKAETPSPVFDAGEIKRLVLKNADGLEKDFPGIAQRYDMNVLKVMNHLRQIKRSLRIVKHGRNFLGMFDPIPDSRAVGLVTIRKDEIADAYDTHGGYNVAAWLDRDSRDKGYLARVAPELAAELDPSDTVWTVIRPDNTASMGLARNIGMSAIGDGAQVYDYDDGVAAPRQLFVSTAGDILQTSRAYVERHYPLEVS